MKVGISVLWLIIYFASPARADVYIVIYATHNGKTGHCGIAVDHYKVVVQDERIGGNINYRLDSVKTGTLTYYDLWPVNDSYKGNYEGDVEARYYKLPSDRWKQWISLRTLSDQGVPHKFGYPCDGLISIPCSKREDFEMVAYLDNRLRQQKAFNAMHHNCCDFVSDAITYLTDREIVAKEFIIKNFATTPNELYKVLAGWQEVEVIKNPGESINGSFVQERVYERFLPLLGLF